jgi:hypothetical protein
LSFLFDKEKQEKEKIICLVGAAVAALKPHKGMLVRVQQYCWAWGVHQNSFILA